MSKLIVNAKQQAMLIPSINHKVEQIVRAVLIGFEPKHDLGGEKYKRVITQSEVLLTSVNTVPLVCQFEPNDKLIIGIADHKGIRFDPSSNSALIVLGLHPTAFLYHLTTTRHNGEALVELQGDNLVTTFGNLVNCAHDAVFNWEKLVYDNERGKDVKTFPLLGQYLSAGKPSIFA